MQAKGQFENNTLSQRWVTTSGQHVWYIVDFVQPSVRPVWQKARAEKSGWAILERWSHSELACQSRSYRLLVVVTSSARWVIGCSGSESCH